MRTRFVSGKRKHSLTVYGYVRSNFDGKCFVDEIIQIIFQFYLSGGGSLYMFGGGQNGRLGIKKYENKLCKKPTICPPFNDMNVLDVSTYGHTLILDVYGDVWSCGSGPNGQLGIGKKKDASTPQKLKLTQPVIAVAAGGSHSLILLNNGYVQSFGYGNDGQLGHGTNENDLSSPKTIDALTKHKITQISASHRHSACLSEDGDLFFFGDNECGQCGVAARYILIPTKIEFDKKVVFVACCSEHSLLISSDGLIYSFGKGKYGQLGLGLYSTDNKLVPTLIEGLKHKRMKICAAGLMHSICIDKEGVVWAFGYNVYGQCGPKTDTKQQRIPKEIEYFISNNIIAKDCAAKAYQSAVISEDGSLYVFGNNDRYQLGLEDVRSIPIPMKLSVSNDLSVKKVSMGYDSTAVIAE